MHGDSHMLAVFTIACLGWPQLYTRCFPRAPSEKIMGAAGAFDPTLAVNVSKTEWTVTCHGGAIVQNVVSADPAYPNCPNTIRANSFGTRTVTAADASVPVNVLCITAYGSPWRYFSSLRQATLSDEEYDVVVIGEGMGGSAAAYAASAAGASVAILSAAASTTALSSGVVWFPLDAPDLHNRSGAAEADSGHLARYTLEGKASFSYWHRALGLAIYGSDQGPALDYEGGRSGNAHRLAGCTALCGAATTQKLHNLAGITPTLFEVGTVLDAPSGRLAVVDAKGARVVVAKAVVFAVGGSAWRAGAYNNILAKTENTGVHLNVATARSWQLSPTDVHWHLEWQRPTATTVAAVTPRWFALKCEPVDEGGSTIAGYDGCADYNRRALALPANVWHDTISETGNGCSPGSSGKWWRDFLANYGGQETCGPGNMQVVAGVIDSKAGFKLDRYYRSVDDPRFFASGTSAAYVLGNTYFGPGATLGWALHTGRVSGEKAAEVSVVDTTEPQFRGRAIPALFGLASVVILVGVAVHFVDNTRYLHYILMPVALLVIAMAIALVVQQDNGVMKAASPHHRNIGWLLVGWLLVQSLAGALLLTGHLPRSWGAVVHRASGIVVLALIASMPFTAQKAAVFYNKRKSYAGPALFLATTVMVATLAVYNLYRIIAPATPPAPLKPAQRRSIQRRQLPPSLPPPPYKLKDARL